MQFLRSFDFFFCFKRLFEITTLYIHSPLKLTRQVQYGIFACMISQTIKIGENPFSQVYTITLIPLNFYFFLTPAVSRLCACLCSSSPMIVLCFFFFTSVYALFFFTSYRQFKNDFNPFFFFLRFRNLFRSWE